MVGKPNPSTSTVEVITASLRRAVYQGKYSSGTPLRQEDLAKQFKVSRIPIREALGILAAEGLLEIQPNRGAFVTSPSPEEAREIFDLRLSLETDTLRRAVPHLTARTIRQLEAVQRELDVEGDPNRWLELDQSFHDTLYAASGRTWTLEHIASLRAVLNRFYLALFTPDTNRSSWNVEHQAILDAAKEGDTEQAVAWLRRHLEQAARLTVEALTQTNTLKAEGGQNV